LGAEKEKGRGSCPVSLRAKEMAIGQRMVVGLNMKSDGKKAHYQMVLTWDSQILFKG